MWMDSFAPEGSASGAADLARVDGAVLGASHDVALAGDVEAVAKGLVGGTGLGGDDVGDGLHLRGGDGEAGRSGPDAVASDADDGSLVNVAGANQARRDQLPYLLTSCQGL
ncbi:hypothetical protein VDGD_21645 [Verticillium dahliae]|nr:hypothetical protein VDGD_21645 [Verticillium dahliae]